MLAELTPFSACALRGQWIRNWCRSWGTFHDISLRCIDLRGAISVVWFESLPILVCHVTNKSLESLNLAALLNGAWFFALYMVIRRTPETPIITAQIYAPPFPSPCGKLPLILIPQYSNLPACMITQTAYRVDGQTRLPARVARGETRIPPDYRYGYQSISWTWVYRMGQSYDC